MEGTQPDSDSDRWRADVMKMIAQHHDALYGKSDVKDGLVFRLAHIEWVISASKWLFGIMCAAAMKSAFEMLSSLVGLLHR